MTGRIKTATENIWVFEGARLNYRVVGSGKPVILLHGSMAADVWNGFEKRLGKFYRVYLPELPGFGASETVEGRLHNTELFAQAFNAFVKHTGLESAPVIAFSLGAAVAVRAAAVGVIRGRLILVGMPIRLESRLLERIVRLPVAARRKLAVNEIARGGILLSILREVIGTADREYALKYLTLLRTSDVRAMVDTDPILEVKEIVQKYLIRVENKTDLVYGEKDKLYSGAEEFFDRDIMVIRGAGHDVFVSRPKETLEMIRKLIETRGSFWKRVWEWWQGRL